MNWQPGYATRTRWTDNAHNTVTSGWTICGYDHTVIVEDRQPGLAVAATHFTVPAEARTRGHDVEVRLEPAAAEAISAGRGNVPCQWRYTPQLMEVEL